MSPIYLNFLNSCRSLRIQVRIKRKSYAFNYEFTCLGSGLPKNAFFHSFILELRTITKLMLANCWTHGPRCVFVCESDSSSRLRLSYRSLSSHACFFSLFQISLRLAHLLPPSIASHNKCHVKLKLRMFWIRSRVRSMINSVYQSIHLVCRWTNTNFLFFFSNFYVIFRSKTIFLMQHLFYKLCHVSERNNFSEWKSNFSKIYLNNYWFRNEFLEVRKKVFKFVEKKMFAKMFEKWLFLVD